MGQHNRLPVVRSEPQFLLPCGCGAFEKLVQQSNGTSATLVQSRSEAVKLKLLVPACPVLQQIPRLDDSLVFQVSTTNTSGDMICSDHHPAAGIPGRRATEQLQRHQNTRLPAE